MIARPGTTHGEAMVGSMRRGGRLSVGSVGLALATLAVPAGAGADPCFAPEDIDGFATFAETGRSEHFAVHQRAGGAPFDVDGLLELLEDARASYIERGWVEPAGMDQHQQLVFVDEAAGGLVARSDAAPCDTSPTGLQDWMTLNQDLTDDETVLGPVVAHELFHAIQRTYDPTLADDAGSTLWFLEASASYEEALVFPAWTQAVTDRSQVWSANPEVGLETVDGSHEYASFVFLRAVEALRGAPDWHRELWEGLGEGWDVLDEVVAGLDVDEDALFAELVRRAVHMDLPGPGELIGVDAAGGAEEAPIRLGGSEGVAAGTCEAELGGACFVALDVVGDFLGLRIDMVLDAAVDPSPWLVVADVRRGGESISGLVVARDSWDGSEGQRGVSLQVDGLESEDTVWLSMVRREPGAPVTWRVESRIAGRRDGVIQDRWQPGCGCDAAPASSSTPSSAVSLVLLPLFILLRLRR